LITGDAAIQVAGERGRPGRQITAGRIDIGLAADGSTPTALVGQDAVQLTLPPDGAAVPGRTIRSNALDATGEPGRGLRNARFSGNAQYRERGGTVDRAASAAVLDVLLKPGMAGIDEAKFAGSVHFYDGKLSALSAAARYDLEKGSLQLTGSEPGAVVPHMANERITVDARQIDLVLVGPKVAATGTVKSVLLPSKGEADGPAEKLPSILKSTDAVNVTSKTLDYDGSASKAAYTGAAVLWQGDTSIKAESIVLDDRTGDMTAGGTVVTTTMLDDVDKNKQKQRVRSIGTAKSFRYDEASRRATYVDDAHLSGPQGDMTATKIELYLKPGGEELERVEGYEKVTLREVIRKTTGDRLTYTADDERYVVTGLPVTAVDACDRETVGKTLTYFKMADTIIVDGNEQTRTRTKNSGNKCP
jgi:lipopolysaccharide export system protein LptA